ncbi:MAG: hypothetical protein LC667_09275 [Thioalkalivibrio sp.]|nr:hypothetical protein [Thioalkalivibrio sp.]
MNRRRQVARAVFGAWDALQASPVGRVLRAIHRTVDPLIYAIWYGVEWVRTRNPRTFDEKVRYKMVRDRRPILTTISDKVAVREHVANTVGSEYLTRVYQVREDAGSIDWHDLPREFVCKVSHASGGVLLMTESADAGVPLPTYTPRGHGRLAVHPEALDTARASEILDHWLRKPYGWSGWKREWAYRNVPPRVLVEEFLCGPEGGIPADYKFYMLDGRCAFIQLDRDRYGSLERDLYTAEWEYMPVSKTKPRSGQKKPRPDRLDEMLRIAERLAAPFDFVRVDLYGLEDRVVFGELTLYPASGRGVFDPPEYGRIMGDRWTVPDRYVE